MNETFDGTLASRIEAIAGEMYERLAFQFPVCMSSDEFHFSKPQSSSFVSTPGRHSESPLC